MAFKKTVKVGQSSVTYFSKKSYEKSKKKKFAEEKATDIESAKRRAKADAKIDAAKAAQRAKVDAEIAGRAKKTQAAKERVAATKAANVEKSKGIAEREAAAVKAGAGTAAERGVKEEKKPGIWEAGSGFAEPSGTAKLGLALSVIPGGGAAKAGTQMVFKRGAEWASKYAVARAAAEAAEAATAKSGTAGAKRAAAEAAKRVTDMWAKGFGAPASKGVVEGAASGKVLTQQAVRDAFVYARKTPAVGILAKLKGYVVNTKTSRLISQAIGVLGLGLGAAYFVKEAIDYYVFPEFQEAEAARSISFAAWQALEAGDIEAYDELMAAGKEAFSESTWEKIFGALPFLRGIPAARKDAKASIAGMAAFASIGEYKKDAIASGASDVEMWEKIAADKAEAAAKELADFEASSARIAAAKAAANEAYLAAKTAQEKKDRKADLENWAAMIKLTEDAHKAKLTRNRKYWEEVYKMRESLQKSQLQFGLL